VLNGDGESDEVVELAIGLFSNSMVEALVTISATFAKKGLASGSKHVENANKENTLHTPLTPLPVRRR